MKMNRMRSEISYHIMQLNLYKADTIRSKKKCSLYGDVHFKECFPKTQLFSKIYG